MDRAREASRHLELLSGSSLPSYFYTHPTNALAFDTHPALKVATKLYGTNPPGQHMQYMSYLREVIRPPAQSVG